MYIQAERMCAKGLRSCEWEVRRSSYGIYGTVPASQQRFLSVICEILSRASTHPSDVTNAMVKSILGVGLPFGSILSDLTAMDPHLGELDVLIATTQSVWQSEKLAKQQNTVNMTFKAGNSALSLAEFESQICLSSYILAASKTDADICKATGNCMPFSFLLYTLMGAKVTTEVLGLARSRKGLARSRIELMRGEEVSVAEKKEMDQKIIIKF
ncbi:hypothetical protein IEQ34_005754 [Dendrobium chrysotoxum]|uniref:Uncharacterized protein n=1 Tax=Dendrobium chrysotoxum TaxID=161865 RepID=A0AAV7HAP3_DENCH|nr:hypothetical protein IEQ34_005754 [Dendrobium chrysotoxum]